MILFYPVDQSRVPLDQVQRSSGPGLELHRPGPEVQWTGFRAPDPVDHQWTRSNGPMDQVQVWWSTGSGPEVQWTRSRSPVIAID